MTKMQVWKKGEGTFRVSSATIENQFYRVRIVGDVSVCTCPHFTQRHSVEECKHIERVKEAVYNADLIDETELGRMKIDLAILMQKAYDIDRRINKLEEGEMSSPS